MRNTGPFSRKGSGVLYAGEVNSAVRFYRTTCPDQGFLPFSLQQLQEAASISLSVNVLYCGEPQKPPQSSDRGGLLYQNIQL